MLSRIQKLYSNVDMFSIVSNLDTYFSKGYFPDFESVQQVEKKQKGNYFSTVYNIRFKKILPRIIMSLLPLGLFQQMSNYTETSIWYPKTRHYTFELECPHFYQSRGTVQFKGLQSVHLEMDFHLTRDLPCKKWIENTITPFIADKYLETLTSIDKKLIHGKS